MRSVDVRRPPRARREEEPIARRARPRRGRPGRTPLGGLVWALAAGAVARPRPRPGPRPWRTPRLQEWWLTAHPGAAELRWREESAVVGAVGRLIRPQHEVIELGAGGGWYTVGLSRNCRRVVAVDRSPQMLEYLTARLFREGISNVEPRRGEVPHCLRELPAADGILAVGLLDYLDDPVAALAAMRRLLRPGGWLVATAPAAGPAGAVSAALGHLMRRPVHVLDEDRARRALQRAGLVELTLCRVGLAAPGRTLVMVGRAGA